MARGPRKTVDEKISAKEELIQSLQIRIKTEQAELEELYREKKGIELEALSDVLKESGLDPEEAAQALRDYSKNRIMETA